MAEVKTLVDSGTTKNLVDQEVAKELGMTLQALSSVQNITNVDGTGNANGPIMQFCKLQICQNKEDVQKFYVTNLGNNQAILGYPWLKWFSPNINWITGEIQEAQPSLEAKWYQIAKKWQENIIIQRAQLEPEWQEGDEIILVAKTNMAQQWAEKALKDRKEPEIPPQYWQFAKVFSEEATKCFPPLHPEDHAIKLKLGALDTINCKVYLLNNDECEATRKWIEENKKKHYIEESNSPWSTPWFLIKKKDSSLRPIQDYREVNKWTVHGIYPMPQIEQIMEELANKKLFTKFNICSGYHNVRIKDKDHWKATFKTPFGLYHPNVMLFGLCNFPATFQCLTNWVLALVQAKYLGVVHRYMDDYLIATHNNPTFHEEVVGAILKQMLKEDLYLKLAKCEFSKPAIEYLGIYIKDGTIHINPTKRSGLATWPRQLSSVTQVWSTLGILGYQQPFIHNFAHIAKPLTNLLKKEVPFEWTQKCTNTLDTLIFIVTSDPVLHHPDHNKQFELEVDASQYVLGVILYQWDNNGKQRPVAYHSETLNEATTFTIANCLPLFVA
jgi:Reverse transcriptase (RNA-dependent DNA polymerase)/RNase H-like domain found in reverse transcriptase/Aspartyl protease